MEIVETDMTMTPSQEFGRWLANAMRAAGYNIDSQRGGGRSELADKLGVSASTVKRWLDGQTMPEPSKFEAIAAAVGVKPIEMLVGCGILSANSLTSSQDPAVRSRPISPSQAADELGIDNPKDRALFLTLVEQLRRPPVAPVRRDEGTATAEG